MPNIYTDLTASDRATVRERLLAGLHPEPNSGCHLWTGAASTGGYGQIRYHRTLFYTHRLAFEFAAGPIPKGQSVLHSCNNSFCGNPSHLRTGSQAENMADMARAGRAYRPTREIYSDRDITDMRGYAIWGWPVSQIRAVTGASLSTIQGVRKGRYRPDAVDGELDKAGWTPNWRAPE